MSASISSVIAQLEMKDTIIANIDIYLPFLYRYVDDCITSIPKERHEKIKKHFNSYYEKLQLTIEIENENKINF